MSAGIELCIERGYQMHKTSSVPLLNKVHRIKLCIAIMFFNFLWSKMFPAYMRSFTFAIKLVITFFGETVKTRVK